MPDLSSENAQQKHDIALQELRELLIGPEKILLANIQSRLEDPELHAKDVAQILAEAIAIRSKQDGKLDIALAATIERVISDSAARNPKPLGDALFPVMGPAIRQSIRHAIQGMLQSLNQALEHTFSIQGLKWRLEALRVGKPFADIVLLHTLLYSVEQVFLIHRETGLLLAHVAKDDIDTDHSDVVSGMLSAIQDFVRDSFGGSEDDALETMEMGDTQVWVDHGPGAIVAIVVRGNAPTSLHNMLRETNENIHMMMADTLAAFSGDATSFANTEQALEALLQTQYQHVNGKGISPWLIAMMVSIPLALLGWGGWLHYKDMRWQSFCDTLAGTPGIELTFCQYEDGHGKVRGLRDPLAASIVDIARRANWPMAHLVSALRPFYSLDASLVLQRAKSTLNPPKNIMISFHKGRLIAKGSAPRVWIENARRQAAFLPGIVAYDDSHVQRSDKPKAPKVDTDAILLDRARVLLLPPAKVQLSVHQGQLYAVGKAHHTWIKHAARVAHNIRGIRSYHAAHIVDIDDPDYILILARKKLAPPQTVTLSFSDGLLTASGQAARSWIQLASRLALQISGVKYFDASHVSDPEERFSALRKTLSGLRIQFSYSHVKPIQDAPHVLDKVAALIHTNADLFQKGISLELSGSTRISGTSGQKHRIIASRIAIVMQMLQARGIPVAWMTVGKRVKNSDHETQRNSYPKVLFYLMHNAKRL